MLNVLAIMSERQLLSEVEHLILLAILRLGGAAYAVTIREEIQATTGLCLSRGTVYVTLSRLEERAYLRSWFADPTAERGGKAKRYFALRPAAHAALERSWSAMWRMWRGVKVASGAPQPVPAGRRA